MITENTVRFSGQDYYTDIILKNNSREVIIPPAMVRDLIIKDNLYSIFPTAILTISTTGNPIENLVNNKIATYNFNVDGEDVIYINIGPFSHHDPDALPEDVYAFKGAFKIYDEEEVLGSDGIEKGKILHLRDMREDILDTTTTTWSTALPVNERYRDKLPLSQVGNTLRETKTGVGIRHRISSVLDNQFFKEWDIGETGVFYSSPANASALDDIEYMLDKHVSTHASDNCILKCERDNKWVLRPISNYFERGMQNSREFVIDMFSITTANQHGTTPSNDPLNEDLDPGNPSRIPWDDIVIKNADGLQGFALSHIANKDSSKVLVSTMAHDYNSSTKQFSIDSKNTHISQVRKKYKKMYLEGNVSGVDPQPIIPINQEKLINTNIRHEYAGGRTQTERLKGGVNKVMEHMLSLAPAINFETNGSSHRQPGRFILVKANNSDVNSSYAKMVEGEWLMTEVVHGFMFGSQEYKNGITCIKSHASTHLDAAYTKDMLAPYENI